MRIAIIVGHIGRGTGATYRDRDEWTLARHDARMLYERLMHVDDIMPAYFEIDRDELRWKILGDLLNDKTDDAIKANWAKEIDADVVIDFHYNSAENTKANGHEIIIPRVSQFSRCIEAALDMLPNRHRDTIVNNGFRLFRKLEGAEIMAVIIEPAFLFEDAIEDKSFHTRLADSLQWGIARYIKNDLEEELPCRIEEKNYPHL